MKSQKNAVCNALLSVLKERGIDYELNGEATIKSVLTSEDKATVKAILIEGFNNDKIVLSDSAKAKYIGNPTGLSTYVNGLINNWIKKNPEFNSGIKYAPENPGSRAGSGDEQIRAMRGLKKTTNDPATLEAIDKEIAMRLAEIKPASVVEINVEALPESLRHLVK